MANRLVQERELYSIEDARFLLGGIARMTIYQLLNSGELSSVVIGRRRFVPAAAITTFIAAAATTSAPSVRRAAARHGAVQMPLRLELPLSARGRRRAIVR